MKKGDKFEVNFEVSDKIYNGFIQIFNDLNPLHTEDEFAIRMGFRQKVMHGNILNGFLSYFVGERLPAKNVIIQTQEIKYIQPVYLGDSLKLNIEISDVFESVSAYEFKFFFLNSEGKKVARGNIQIGLLK